MPTTRIDELVKRLSEHTDVVPDEMKRVTARVSARHYDMLETMAQAWNLTVSGLTERLLDAAIQDASEIADKNKDDEGRWFAVKPITPLPNPNYLETIKQLKNRNAPD
jgi:hypothetical protein